ncbi:MAG: nucleotide disphospho-sugar-binding domain-containing protein [Pseudomonadota bacterium]
MTTAGMKQGGKRALLAWEMGAGLGHIRRLLTVAEAMKSRGYEPVIAQRTIHTLADEVREAGISMIPIPPQISLAPKGQPFRAMTYADIMAICGYARMDVLRPILDAWDGLLAHIQPDVVIGDYCPILPMAVRSRLPFVAFGDGFVVPPHEPEIFPPLRAEGEPIKPVEQITEDVNGLLRERGQDEISHLGQLVAGDAQVVTTLPELDIYHAHRSIEAVGPLDEPPPVRPMPKEAHLFVYLAADFANSRKALQAVANMKVSAEAFIRDAPEQLRNALRNNGMTVHDTPPPLAEVLSRATVILHHGGMGTLETALAMGCAQILMPRHLEQSLNAGNLRNRKIAEIIRGDDMDHYQQVLTKAMKARKWQEAMYQLGMRLDKRRPMSGLEPLLDAIDKAVA